MPVPQNWNYVSNIPDGPNNPSDDQPNMKINTNSISGFLSVDHFGFGNNQGGAHEKVQLFNVAGSTPPAGLLNGYETIYSQAIAGNGELFFTRGNSGTGIQLTGPGTPTVSQNGYTFLPGGILIQWGIKLAAGTSGSVSFPTNFKAATTPFTIQLTLFRNSGNQSVAVDSGTPPSNTQFNYRTSSGGSDIYWLAIGQG